ncbi:MAG: DUF3540 domain-containing protein, partial [Gemmatimonadota bacterium]
MLTTAPEPHSTASGTFVRPATVLASTDDMGHVRVRLDDDSDESEVRARFAAAGARPPSPGDRALLAFSDTGEAFLIGLISRQATQAPRIPAEIPFSDGSSLRLSGEEAAERLTLLSADHRPLLEYDAASGRITLSAPTGDLELSSCEGDIVLNASGSVLLRGEVVEATGRSRVGLGIDNSSGKAVPLVSLDPSTARIAGPILTVAAQRANLHLNEATYTGTRLSARIGALTAVVRRIERVVDEVHERAGRVYTTVRELLEIRAGRIRTLVDSTYRL